MKHFWSYLFSSLREHKFQLENFRTGTENATIFHKNCNVLENMRILSKCVMYLIAPFFP